MIGVLCEVDERKIVQEFFELFKTPWEFFSVNRKYDVVISTSRESLITNARLVIHYSSASIQYDDIRNVRIEVMSNVRQIIVDDTCLPIYGKLSNFISDGTPLILDQSTSKAVAVAFSETHGRIIRVGYDLFQEFALLLTEGQPVENALIPAVEVQILILKNWIIKEGIVLVEIPPIPWGYQFFACLTHDVDFAGIRKHFLDHTMWGFVYRGVIGSLLSFLKGRTSLAKLIKNWSAVIKLPLVFLGISDDFWEHFDQYTEIDNGFGSTYFLIPYKNKAGSKIEGTEQQRRAVRYDISDVSKQVTHLMSLGDEIGLHGIDAWHSQEKGLQELIRISEVTGQKKIGIRIHWLCYNNLSPKMLEQAGFDYDATLGYNETIGFKNGTSQIFQPLGVTRLLEIPLNIQDTSLFFPRRMALSEADANRICNQLLDAVFKFKGVLTLSWHERSLAPERLWGDFYIHLLQELQSHHAWIGSARQVVDWFRQRRSIIFEETSLVGNKFILKIRGDHSVVDPQMFFRFHIPRSKNKSGGAVEQQTYDILCNGDTYLEIPLMEEIEA